MVQGSKPDKYTSAATQGFQSKPVKKQQLTITTQVVKSPPAGSDKDKSKSYGSWGSQFKNQENFKSMHQF